MLEVALLQCDGCGKMSQENFAVGWKAVDNVGIEVNTMSTPQKAMSVQHYCGIQCLKTHVV